MTLTLFTLAVAAVCVSVLYAVAAAGRAEAVSIAGEQPTVVGLGDAAAETLPGGARRPAGAGAGVWSLATMHDLTDAEDLLDYLEAHGVADRELVVLGNSAFAVRWR